MQNAAYVVYVLWSDVIWLVKSALAAAPARTTTIPVSTILMTG